MHCYLLLLPSSVELHRAFMIAMVLVGTVGFICIFVAHRREQFNNLYGLVPLDRVSFHISLTVTTIAVRV